MTARRLRAAALWAFVASAAVGCETRTAEEPSRGVVAVGLPPWTVGGARLGMTAADAARILGEPIGSRSSHGVTTTTWKGISVSFGADGRAVEVVGDRLTSPSGATIVSRGAADAEVVRQLGPGHLQADSASKSGLISCLKPPAGTDRTYQDATTRYQISIQQNRLTGVRLRPR